MLVADNVRSITQKAVGLNVVRKQYFMRMLFSRIWIEYRFFNKDRNEYFCRKIDEYIISDSENINIFDKEMDHIKIQILEEIPRMVDLESPQHSLAEDALISALYFCKLSEDVNIDSCIGILIGKYVAICDEYIQHYASIRNGGQFIDDNNTINSDIFSFEMKQCCDYLGIADRLVAAEVISANLSGPPMCIRWQG